MFNLNLAPRMGNAHTSSRNAFIVPSILITASLLLFKLVWEHSIDESSIDATTSGVAKSARPVINKEVQVGVVDCDKYQSRYQLLGVLLSGKQFITIVKNNITEQSQLISYSKNKLDGLNLISSEIKKATYQIGSCQFSLSMSETNSE